MSARGFFVTGTDTGVGKTLAACALLHAFAARGLRVIGMKPVAAGAEEKNGVLINDDVEQLIAASNIVAPRADVNPYCFEPPIAPHIAAAIHKTSIQIDKLCECYGRLTTLADVVLVEGAGGFCVPFNDHESSADFAQRLALPVVLVVGLRLGCINHALLTVEAIRARGLRLAGWIANEIEPTMAHADANVAAIEARLAAPSIGRVAFCNHPHASKVARRFDLSVLL